MEHFFNDSYNASLARFKGMLNKTLKDNSKTFIDELLWIVDSCRYFEPTENIRIKPTSRQEANVITAFCFRNTILEDIHSKEVAFNNDVMKQLMIESSLRVKEWLIMRDTFYDGKNKINPMYFAFIYMYEQLFTSNWEK